MAIKKFAVIGCGFWAHYQVAAWHELDGAQLVAVCDKDLTKAQALASKYQNVAVYTNAKQLFNAEKIDFVDIISSVETHKEFVLLAASYGVDVICQKPMATTIADCTEMLEVAKQSKIKAFVHENFRFQAPMRAVKSHLESNQIGKPFKANIKFCCSFPIFTYQPALKELEQFIISDLGVHLLDLVRFLFGDVLELVCKTQRINTEIKGEDVASIFLETLSGVHCYVEMSYASRMEHEKFPETFITIEATKGSLYLGKDGEIRITTQQGTTVTKVQPQFYSWVDPDFAASQASAVAANDNLLQGMNGLPAETSFEDNFKTMQLVFGSYKSAENKCIVKI